ncbi:MAG: sulfotransferase [Pseudomonadota bacterium]
MNTNIILQQSLSFVQSKQYNKASDLLLPLIHQSPDLSEAQELMGLSLFFQNEYLEARDYLFKAQHLQPEDARYNSNLGECFRKLKDYDCAEEYLKKSLKKQANYLPAQFNLACTFKANKKPKEALKIFNKLIRKYPNNASYNNALADTLRETGKNKRAIGFYKKAIKLDPKFFLAYSNLGPLLLSVGKVDKALEHCREAIALAPTNGLSHMNLGRCLSGLEQYDEAMDAYADALELIPDNAMLLSEVAKNWLLVNDLMQAEYWFMQAVDKDNEHIPALCGLADTHREGGLLEKALDEINAVIEKHPKAHIAYVVRAKIHLDLGNSQECLDDHEKLINLKKGQASLYSAYGHALQNAGEIEKAQKQFYKALSKNPACINALNGLATTLRGKLNSKEAENMESLLENKEYQDGTRASLHNGLGYYYDGIKSYSKAASHINSSNHHYWLSKSKKGWSYDPDQYRRKVDTIIETFDETYFKKLNDQDLGHNSQLPAFIVGMPRSGTTLTEQILNAHPQVLGIGEQAFSSISFSDLPKIFKQVKAAPYQLLPHVNKQLTLEIAEWYLQQLQGLQEKSGKQNISRIVDKMPDNYSHIGWILTLFPNAKIIHARRDVRDVAVSCWMTQFGKIRWAFNLDHLVERIIQYDRLMKHWRKVIPDRFIETDYEALVQDQEFHSKKLIKFLGLPWDSQCLNFHKQEVVVRTASVTQVRQPIYKKSLQRWKRYEKPLQEIFEKIQQENVSFWT